MEIVKVAITYICVESNFNKSEIHQGTGQEPCLWNTAGHGVFWWFRVGKERSQRAKQG